MKTPVFWYEKPGIVAQFLWPLSWIYGAITAWRMRCKGTRMDIPVICVGNFTAGGAGKTPVVLMLAETLTTNGERPFVISRGYGGKLRGPVLVEPLQHAAHECGDEPLLLAAHVPTVVARDRVAGAAFARKQGATVLLLDDGLQNPTLTKDFTIAVVDGDVGIGNGFCIPAGPLRAPLADQILYIDCIVMVGRGAGLLSLGAIDKSVVFSHLQPDADAVTNLRGLQLMAFAGIGRPEKFFETLRQCGLAVEKTQSFADHHPYSDMDIQALKQTAALHGLTLVTTEKDLTRLPSNSGDIKCLPVRLALADQRLLQNIDAAIRGKRR